MLEAQIGGWFLLALVLVYGAIVGYQWRNISMGMSGRKGDFPPVLSCIFMFLAFEGLLMFEPIWMSIASQEMRHAYVYGVAGPLCVIISTMASIAVMRWIVRGLRWLIGLAHHGLA